jgi:hypothetical protein
MNIVEFLDARIAEQEAGIHSGTFTHSPGGDTVDDGSSGESLAGLMLQECAQARAVLTAWREAADAEGITDPADAEGTVAVARRAMLQILAGGFKDHPDYQAGWQAHVPHIGAAGGS